MTEKPRAPDFSRMRGSTMTKGAPAPSDRNSLTIGRMGRSCSHDVHFLEQMAHFEGMGER